MQDRVSRYPGRYKISKVSNGIYNLERADEPSQVGTILNKANLLSDATATKLGLTSDATPNDAFNKLADGGGVISVYDDGTVHINSKIVRIMKQPGTSSSARLYVGAGNTDYINTGESRELTIYGGGGIKLETGENKSVTINGKEIGVGGGGNVEVGTWTPTSSVMTIESGYSSAYYVKIDKTVLLYWSICATGTTDSEFFFIGGLPFSPNLYTLPLSSYATNFYGGGGVLTNATINQNTAFSGYSIQEGTYGKGIYARASAVNTQSGFAQKSAGFCGVKRNSTKILSSGTIVYRATA